MKPIGGTISIDNITLRKVYAISHEVAIDTENDKLEAGKACSYATLAIFMHAHAHTRVIQQSGETADRTYPTAVLEVDPTNAKHYPEHMTNHVPVTWGTHPII